MAKKITNRTTKEMGRALVSLAAAPVPVPAEAVIVRDGDTVLVSGAAYSAGGRLIPEAEVFYVKGLKEGARGPWLKEADKLAWRDAVTGLECIIMRAERGGYLCGYVGIPAGHPLYGFAEDAIPAGLEIEVHGGVSYGRRCQHGPSPRAGVAVEARLVCHATQQASHRPVSHATDYRIEDEDAWWIGFACNHAYDLTPNDEGRPPTFMEREIGRTYRDEGYVYDQVVNLAAQLKAIADGDPKPTLVGPPPPPIGLDPGQAR